MIGLGVAAALFVALHFGVAGNARLRAALVRRLGEGGYLGGFSVASGVLFVALCVAYARAPTIHLWGLPFALRPVAFVGVFIAALFVVVGLLTPSPTAAGGDRALSSEEPARGILRITRHPFLSGVALWAGIHQGVNGDAASQVFFGALLVLAVLGPTSIDAKRAARHGERWQRFAACTSRMPFLAISQGRNRLVAGELGVWRVVAAVAAFLALWLGHPALFGVAPLPL